MCPCRAGLAPAAVVRSRGAPVGERAAADVNMTRRLFLGIDGGASKTAGVLFDDIGRLLASHSAGGCAIVAGPSKESLAVLAGAVDALCAQADVGREDIRRCGIGLNGVDFEDEIPMQRKAVALGVGIPATRMRWSRSPSTKSRTGMRCRWASTW